MSKEKEILRRSSRVGGKGDGVERAVLRWYRWAVAGLALVLLVAAGVMTFMENSESAMEERSVLASDIYPFSFITQETEAVSSGKDNKEIKDSAVRSIVDSDEVYYSDSFFTKSNSLYDHELARASLALSMTAFNQENVEAFLEELGYEGTVFYRYGQQNDEDRVALAISHKNAGCERALNGENGTPRYRTSSVCGTTSMQPIIAVVIRGGQYGDEWGSNGRVGYEGESFGYHYGFRKAAEDAIAQLKNYAAEYSLPLPESKIWITGFSRGAAVANVMGALLTGQAGVRDSEEQGYDEPSGNPAIIRPENLFDYTFASPNTVSDDLITGTGGIDANAGQTYRTATWRGIYNIINPLDIVTRLPMNANGISESASGKTVRYNWDYVKYGMNVYLPSDTASAQLQVVQLLENALAFATRNEARYVKKTQDQVIIPALKKTMGKGANVSKRNVGYVLVESLPGVAAFLKNEVNQLDLKAQIYVAGILSGKQNIRLEKEHWPETYWGWMVKVDGLE